MNVRLIYIIIAVVCLLMFVVMVYPLLNHVDNGVKENNSDNNLSYNNWTYDKKEYPMDSYTLDEICPPHTSANSIQRFFNESDFNHDGLLTGREISAMDYKLKHSQYTYNGPYGYN
ncbi:MAG: hypothetical protein BZ137_01410 [Methanosphaera sp. rholeuAM130]|nr:MAG: hypothetical protein BZ137_01410 [Methanosphaera sp. rholeuAM130]